jgi:hypothetical protein
LLLKAKGVSELGTSGVAAVIANEIYSATGVRVRDYPITLDKLIDRSHVGCPASYPRWAGYSLEQSLEFVLTTYLDPLFPNERAALIAALRRDIQSERTQAAIKPEWSDLHLMNVRLSVRLLEAFGEREDESDPRRTSNKW